ncbi:MAG: hypothetical protein QHH75_13320 [Bacillota bacterium]|nr:hypothetical protein [Bacillota bacterium]
MIETTINAQTISYLKEEEIARMLGAGRRCCECGITCLGRRSAP